MELRLFLQPNINKEFVFQYQSNASVKTYGEQYKSDWWCMTEKKIFIGNNFELDVNTTGAT